MPYSLEIAGSNPGYVIANRDRGFLGGGAQLAERRLGREGLRRQGNPRFTTHQRPLWLIGCLSVCSGAIQIGVVLWHYGSGGFGVRKLTDWQEDVSEDTLQLPFSESPGWLQR